MIKIVIPLIPTGKMVQRSSAILTNEQKGNMLQAMSEILDDDQIEMVRKELNKLHPRLLSYKCDKQRSREAALGAFIAPHVNGEPLSGPLRFKVGAYIKINKSWSKKKKQQALDGEIWPTVTPDMSNLLKQIEDVCTNMGLIKDDKYICELMFRKQYSDRPRWEFSFEQL